MRTVVVLAALLTAGCVTSRPVSLPNGVQGLAINCPGAIRDIGDCMNRAAEECGGPYSILTRDGEVVSSVGSSVDTGYGSGIAFTRGIKRTLIVQCHE